MGWDEDAWYVRCLQNPQIADGRRGTAPGSAGCCPGAFSPAGDPRYSYRVEMCRPLHGAGRPCPLLTDFSDRIPPVPLSLRRHVSFCVPCAQRCSLTVWLVLNHPQAPMKTPRFPMHSQPCFARTLLHHTQWQCGDLCQRGHCRTPLRNCAPDKASGEGYQSDFSLWRKRSIAGLVNRPETVVQTSFPLNFPANIAGNRSVVYFKRSKGIRSLPRP